MASGRNGEWAIVSEIIPNFLFLLASQKFILFVGKGEVSVGRNIYFGSAGCWA